MITTMLKAKLPQRAPDHPCERLTDLEFKRAFEAGAISDKEFRHVDHLRLAWVYLSICRPEAAAQRIEEGIRRFAAANHHPQMFHLTITRFWIGEVQRRMQATEREASFRAFLEQNSRLLDKNYIYRFYTRDVLMSESARKMWVKPDLDPGER